MCIRDSLDGVEVRVYPPAGAPSAAEMIDNRPVAALTRGRAALLAMMRGYQEATFEAPSVIEVQKLMYFLQAAGEALQLKFVRHHYGPYADNLRAVLRELEGQYIVGFGDGSQRVNEAEPLSLVSGHDTDIDAALTHQEETLERMSRVLALADGFESAYGLELLASTHWVAPVSYTHLDVYKRQPQVCRPPPPWSPSPGPRGPRPRRRSRPDSSRIS